MCAYSDYVSSTESNCSLDAVHDAWIEMHPKYGSQLSAAALRKRATYRQRDESRRAHRRVSDNESQTFACPAWQQPEEMAIENERDQLIETLVGQLPPELARLIYLRYWRDLTVAEISILLSRPSKTIYRWLDQAHQRLADTPLLRQAIE